MRTRLLPLFAAALSALSVGASAQNRLPKTIAGDESRVTIADSVNRHAREATDLGATSDDTPIQSVSLRFNLTAAQNAALDALLNDQQNPASARYHQWLSPEQYATQFGLSSADLATVSRYLQSQGLTVTAVARSHSFVTVSGTAAQIDRAFKTTLHNIAVDGEQHMANLTEPSLPASIAGVVRGITGLNDFRLKPHVHARQVMDPKFTSATSGNHFIAPGDFYTIYNLNPLLASSIDGSGITIAVMGQTDISLTDIAAFRAASGLSVNPPTIKVYAPAPGVSKNTADIDEASLDIEWSGAAAPAATILYVNTTDVISGSLTQAVDNNLAPIITISYGDCEPNFGSSNLAIFNQLFRQANAQGQTILGPAGDSGATDCDYQLASAVGGLAVDYPASSPYVTGVGGSMFNEGSGSYFNATNGQYSGSAISYIPEAVWNESATLGTLAATGGGPSLFFTKPSYQFGLGVPNDFSRDVPDLALNAAAGHDGYLICARGSCTSGYRSATGFLDVIGGTSASTPSFAGMLALVEQKINQRVGNANPVLYSLANSTYSSAVFHDITTGTNASPCTAGSIDCPTGGAIGYAAGSGFDLATGWGSVDAFNLVNDWLLVTPAGIVSMIGQTLSSVTVSSSSLSVPAGNSVSLSVTVRSGTSAATTTPTGTVQLLVDNVPQGNSVALSGGAATLTLSTTGLASGSHKVAVAYSGDSTYASSKGTVVEDIISATASDFSLTPASPSTTVSSGKTSGGITLTVTPVNGFTGSVNFAVSTASTALANSATTNFTVNPVVISGSNAGTTVLTLSAFVTQGVKGIGFAKPGTQARQTPTPGWRFTGSGIAMAALLVLLIPARRRRWTSLAVALLSVGLLAVTGCSQSNAPSTPPLVTTNTPAGVYTVTITATGSNAAGVALTHSSILTVTVQ